MKSGRVFHREAILARIGAGNHHGTFEVNETADREGLERQLEELKSEHRDLDEVIARIAEEAPFDQLQIQRLKKRKLQLRDQLAKIESLLLPDIIA
jgi:hypothetical protein